MIAHPLATPVVHRQSHRALLQEFRAGRQRTVDAIIVPAGRSAAHLLPAGHLAAELGCTLLVMRAPEGADLGEFAELVEGQWHDLDWRHLTVPNGYTHPRLPATGSSTFASVDWRHGPLSTKRNLALLMARMLGWRTVLLLDDDIAGLRAPVVLDAASGLERSAAVGFAVRSWPDNSVVCHANRLAGGDQDVFVGACALLLDVSSPFGFFPNIYNEDWLFLYDDVRRRHVSRVGRAQQVRYDPFGDPGRAVAEEFGEIIAEGLMAGLHLSPCSVRTFVDVGYWARFLESRHAYTERITAKLADRSMTDRQQRALRSLAAAAQRRSTVTPESCADYFRAWRGDLRRWRDHLTGLPTFVTFDAAAEYLGLATSMIGITA